MPRQAYHITSGTPDAGYTKVEPKTWYNVGAVLSVQTDAVPAQGIVTYVNIEEDKAGAVKLGEIDDVAHETAGRPLSIFGPEGYKFITDDGNV